MFKVGTKRDYMTTEDILWSCGGKYARNTIVIIKGFEFESSVPWYIPSFIVSKHDPDLLLSACVHDYLLEVERYEVLAAAAEWHSAAKKSKVKALKRIIMFFCVCAYTLRSKKYTQS